MSGEATQNLIIGILIGIAVTTFGVVFDRIFLEYRENKKQRLMKEYNWDHIAEKTIRVYKQILQT